MSHKIAYVVATLMIVIAMFVLYFHYEIIDSRERILILAYMIVYGALMAWSEKK